MADEMEGHPPKAGRWGSLKSFGKGLLKVARDSSAGVIEATKKSLSAAGGELSKQLGEASEHARHSGVTETKVARKLSAGLGAAGAVASKTVDNTRTASRKARESISFLGAKASAIGGSGSDARHPMDCDAMAGFGLVTHYSKQFGSMHARSEEIVSDGKTAGTMLAEQSSYIAAANAKCLSLQTELCTLPNIMTVLSGAVSTIFDLRDRIHALEEDLGELEQVHCDLKIANDTILAKRTIEEYDRKVSNSVELHKRNVLAEYQRASRAASKAASVMVADRSILGELASVAQTAASPTFTTSETAQLSTAGSTFPLDSGGDASLAAFLESTDDSRSASPVIEKCKGEVTWSAVSSSRITAEKQSESEDEEDGGVEVMSDEDIEDETPSGAPLIQ